MVIVKGRLTAPVHLRVKVDPDAMAFGRRHKRRKTGVLVAIAAPTSRPLTRAHRDAVEDVVDDFVAEDGFDNDLAMTSRDQRLAQKT